MGALITVHALIRDDESQLDRASVSQLDRYLRWEMLFVAAALSVRYQPLEEQSLDKFPEIQVKRGVENRRRR